MNESLVMSISKVYYDTAEEMKKLDVSAFVAKEEEALKAFKDARKAEEEALRAVHNAREVFDYVKEKRKDLRNIVSKLNCQSEKTFYNCNGECDSCERYNQCSDELTRVKKLCGDIVKDYKNIIENVAV